MTKYIIDTSIILKAILKEDDSVAKVFLKLLNGTKTNRTQIFSQQLLITEVANGIRYTEGSCELGQKYFDIFLELPIKYLTITEAVHKKILEVSYTTGTTVYDTSYHILAKEYKAVFLTSDEDYYKKACVLGDIELVK